LPCLHWHLAFIFLFSHLHVALKDIADGSSRSLHLKSEYFSFDARVLLSLSFELVLVVEFDLLSGCSVCLVAVTGVMCLLNAHFIPHNLVLDLLQHHVALL